MNYNNLLLAAKFVPKRMVFPDAWCGHIPFAAWLMSELKPKVFVELGTHTGNSYLSFCQAVDELKQDTKCYAIDHWQGDEHAGLYDNKIYEDLSKYHDPLYGKFSKLVHKSFDEALADFSDKSIDLLHIDGFHTYEAVKHDFESWLPKLTDNAVVLFHDTCVFERNFGVWKFWEELCLKYDMNLNFQHSNGLGVLQLLPLTNNKLTWLTIGNTDRNKIIQYFEALGESNLVRFKANLLQDELQAQCNARQSAEREIGNARQSAERERCNALAIEHKVIELESEIKAIQDTFSWKITRPLRLVRRVSNKQFLMTIVPRAYKKILRTIIHWCGGNAVTRNKLCSNRNPIAHMDMVAKRCEATENIPTIDPITAKLLTDPPNIDICVVTHNSSKWVSGFISSITKVNYPFSKIFLYFIDNNSSDDTLKQLNIHSQTLINSGVTVNIIQNQNNKGFGAGNNLGIKAGKSEFCLVTNIDLAFESNAIVNVISTACSDKIEVAAWELRQKPYEHPKFYDPVTGLTNWNSHACVLLRRSSFENVGGYDETIFMYGEDVELSYRFRQKGYLLRYIPRAVVYHYTYVNPGQVKPIQYVGSIFANFYIRLKYGNWGDILVIPFMMMMLLAVPETYKGIRRDLLSSFAKLIMIVPRSIFTRATGYVSHPFRAFDYEMSREGAFIEASELKNDLPLVSIITRTYQGREILLRQALLSVAHQTYSPIEHIIVQDGGNSMSKTVEAISHLTNQNIKFIGLEKCGRSATGNAGLAAAKGKWCLFLDDDDLLFCDHIETLVNAIIKNPGVVASYSLAWEIKTDLIEKKGVITGYTEVIVDAPTVIKQVFSRKGLLEGNYLPIQSVLFERSLFETRGGFDEDLEALEDWLLWNRYAKDNTFAYVEKCTSMYRTPYNLSKARKRNNAFVRANPIVRERIKLLYNNSSFI
jgi:GT2 family glycosyltransferase